MRNIHESNQIVVWVINPDITFLKGKSPGHDNVCPTCGLYYNKTNRFHSESCGFQNARGKRLRTMLNRMNEPFKSALVKLIETKYHFDTFNTIVHN